MAPLKNCGNLMWDHCDCCGIQEYEFYNNDYVWYKIAVVGDVGLCEYCLPPSSTVDRTSLSHSEKRSSTLRGGIVFGPVV